MPIPSQPYLNILESLNLYNPKNVYSLDNNRLNNTISTIGSLATNNSFDFSNTLLSRVLLPNTPIQQVANRELAKALAVRVGQNLRTNLLPSVTQSNIIDFNINKPANYWNISGKEKQSFSDLVQVMLGYQRDVNPVPFIGSNFSHEDSNNWLKKNRGEGYQDEYQKNINRNQYRDQLDSQYGKDDMDAASIKKGQIEESLLFKTNELLNQNSLSDGIPADPSIQYPGDKLNPTAKIFKHIGDDGEMKLIPKGGGTTTDDSGSKFLRVFTKQNKYGSTSDLMKYNHGYAGTNSVLQTVFPNIAPINETDVKNLMFSIENLAYKDAKIDIKPSEHGANGGRVMWFAPYDLQISENSSAGWDKVTFIGRSEPIYTYNGSERQCVISFVLIADYPSELNKFSWKNKSNNEHNKFFKQDNILTKNLSTTEKSKIDVKKVEERPVEKPKPLSSGNNPFALNQALKYYYDNNDYTLKTTLTQDNNVGTGQKAINDFNARINDLIAFLNTEEGKKYQVVIDTFTSKLDNAKYNKLLSFFRGKSLYNRIESNLTNIDNYKLRSYDKVFSDGVQPTLDQYKNDKFTINFYGEERAKNQNSTVNTVNEDVVDRRSYVYLKANPKLNTTITDIKNQQRSLFEDPIVIPEVVINPSDEFYFERYNQNEDVLLATANDELTDNLLKTYSDNIKYFHPVFHSQTPEDLNTRVTFLQQCLKQGTVLSGSTVSNGIFGRPPVCVLRIGDFFNTKIIINNISFDYEPLLWDMNPEGIGMQPMLCRVNMSCNIIGGSSLSGPVNKLQTALDYNFYANTEVYNKI